MPFHSANEDESCRLAYFVKSRGTITNPHYPSFCRAWSFSPDAKLLQTWLSSKLSVYLSRPGSSQGGCYHKGPICYPGFTPSQKPLFGTFIYQEKAVNVSKKVCTLSLCHGCYWFPPYTDSSWMNLRQLLQWKKDHNYADVNYLELLSCAPVETPRLILMLIFCVLIALQHKTLDGVGTSTVGGSSY